MEENELVRARRPTGIKLRFSLKKKREEEQQIAEEEAARSIDAPEASSQQTAGAANISSSPQSQAVVPESPKDKGKDKESKKEKRERERAELIAAMQEEVRGWEHKLQQYTIAGKAEMEQLRAQLAAKDKEYDRVHLTMQTYAENLLAIGRGKDQEISSLQNQLAVERLGHQEAMRDAAERANSTEKELRWMLAEKHTTNVQLRQDLSHQKAAEKALQQSLAECQASTAKQPPVELPPVEQLLVQLPPVEQLPVKLPPVEQPRVEQDGDLAKVAEEKRGLEERVAGLRQQLEASEAKIGSQEIDFQELEKTIRPLQSRVKELVDDNFSLSQAKKRLESSLLESNSLRGNMSTSLKEVEKSARRADKESTAVVMKMDKIMEKYHAEVSALRVQNQALEAQMMLKRHPGIAIAELDRRQKELDRRQKAVDRLTIELGEVTERLADCEAKIQRDAEEAEEAEKGEWEMNAQLGVPEKASEGLLRSLFPQMGLDFWVLVGLFLMGLCLVVAFSPDSATTVRERLQERHATAMAMRCGRTPGWDPHLHLSRGMYGGYGG